VRRLLSTPNFALVWFVGFFEEVGFFLLVNVPGRLHQLGVDESGIGLAYAVAALAALLLRPMFGKALDVFRRRSVLRATGIVNVTAVTVLAMVDVVGATLWGAFLVQRIAQILLFTTLLTYAADTLPPALRTSGLAIFGLSGLLPIAVSNLLGDAVIGTTGYQGAIGVAAGACGLSWALTWRLPALPVLGTRPRRSFWAALNQADLRPLWLISLMFAAGVETLFTFMRTYVDTRGAGSLGLFFAVYGTAAIITRLGGGNRYDVLPHRLVVTSAVTGFGVAMVTLALATGLAGFLVAAAVAGAAHGIVFPVISSQVVGRARTAERGSAVATFTSIFDVAVLALAPVVGIVIDRLGYPTAFGSVGLTIAAGAGAYGWWDRRRERSALPA
jgi:predicted MFS family arabinose efflux permease